MLEPFYKDGLKFECTQCHACCRHDPGYVFLSRPDLQALCQQLHTSENDFVERFCRWVDLGDGLVLSLREKKNFDCIFWDQGCTVYASRPVQCRTYPFWESPLKSLESWTWEGRYCPGVNRGKVHTQKEIEAALAKRRESPVIRGGQL
ncbi:MAG: YkgJ family cysteine cluster protein [Spirochaetales bacterium]